MARDNGFSFVRTPWQPRLGLKADIASGDGDLADGRLGTFNALFPRLPYFTEANVVAPANVIDLQPSLTLAPARSVAVTLGWNLLWKHRTADAFYGAPLSPIAATVGVGRFMGHQASLGATWSATPNLTLSGSYVQFWASDGLQRAGGREGDFFMTSVSAKF